MASEKNYDELLCPIICNEGIIGFFDRIFDFLYRRTDYFKSKSDASSNMGLEPGEAEKIVRSVFCKYMEQAASQQKLEVKTLQKSVDLDYVSEEVVTTTTELEVGEDLSGDKTTTTDEGKADESSNADRPDQQSELKVPWMDPDCYNGARYTDYSWAQTLKDIDIRLKVSKEITTGKQVKVSIHQGSINAETLSGKEWNVLKKGVLSQKINVEESAWTLVPGEHIHICLQKMQERWWLSLFEGEPKIDAKSIDSTMAYEDLDEEAQAKINELMYDQHQKRLGKPTIQQNKIQGILKEAWDSEGSPFKGQPYDPTIVDIQNTGNL